jgi:glycosyltransferase involved in cell wall biosynthesis
MIFCDQLPDEPYDLIFASDFLDVAAFRGLAPKKTRDLPLVLYMHENQITYPVQEEKERDRHFSVTNISSIMAADQVWWNSQWHQTDFLSGASAFLERMPGGDHGHWLDKARSGKVMPIGVDLPATPPKGVNGPLKIVWNHRWEFDKRPDLFFFAMDRLVQLELDFELHILGERYKSYPEIFDLARKKFANHIVTWGYRDSREDYIDLLRSSDLVVSTADHEFFGISVVEATHFGCVPLLPNRLAYPEIFSNLGKDLTNQIFYNTMEELVEKLTQCCQNPGEVRSLRGDFSCSEYGWQTRKSLFDKAFEQVLS